MACRRGGVCDDNSWRAQQSSPVVPRARSALPTASIVDVVDVKVPDLRVHLVEQRGTRRLVDVGIARERKKEKQFGKEKGVKCWES